MVVTIKYAIAPTMSAPPTRNLARPPKRGAKSRDPAVVSAIAYASARLVSPTRPQPLGSFLFLFLSLFLYFVYTRAGAPHCRQNWSPGLSGWPHWVQKLAGSAGSG